MIEKVVVFIAVIFVSVFVQEFIRILTGFIGNPIEIPYVFVFFGTAILFFILKLMSKR